VLAMLHWLGIKPSYSRPRVSDDNAFVKVLFRTAKYRRSSRSKGSPSWTAMGGVLRALVQQRASPQWHSLCHAWAASCRLRSPRVVGVV
jgi:hypothetical protein